MDFVTWALAAAGIVAGLAMGWTWGRRALSDRCTALATELRLAREKLSEQTGYHERAVTAEAEKKALEKRLGEQQAQLRQEFSNMANQLLEDMTKKFSTRSEEKLGHLLNPMQERLNEFKKLVADSFTAHGQQQHTLKSEIEKIVLQTDSLTKALRGDVKAQGNWGEVMLERLLEESGLQKGSDYIIQASETGEEGRLRPDVIVNLPDDKHIIVDSKVSLTAYERYCAEADETARAVHLREFLKSVRTHVTGLSEKRYQDIARLGTPDFVLLFMPIEGAWSLAVQQDADLQHYAWSRKVTVVSPTNLFATLRTVASLWRIERQNRHAEEIAQQAGRIYDKFVGFIDDMQQIGKQTARLQDCYEQAMNKLKDGRGNLVSSAEKLRELGAKTTKSLPRELTGADDMPDIKLVENQ